MLKNILEDFGFHVCPLEPTLVVYYVGNETILVITSTDDFLCVCSNDQNFARLKTHMERFVPVTTQDGKVMKYINTRIIQTDEGISIDQTHRIKTAILDNWFPPKRTEQLKTADAPYRTDSDFERQLETQLPAIGEDLKLLEKKHGGKYNALLGQVLHIAQVTRMNLAFA